MVLLEARNFPQCLSGHCSGQLIFYLGVRKIYFQLDKFPSSRFCSVLYEAIVYQLSITLNICLGTLNFPNDSPFEPVIVPYCYERQ